MTPPPKSPIERLLARTALEQLDRDLYVGDPGHGEGRLFGGMVAAQSVVAACRTVESLAERPLHSVHAYFLRPGAYGVPIRFVVDRIRDGRTFTTRRVVAHQGGEAIFNLAASFARPEAGQAHQAPMPAAPPPAGLPSWAQLRSGASDDDPFYEHDVVEVRVIDRAEFEVAKPRFEKRLVWMRLRGVLPEDPAIHAAALAYASDRTLLSTALRPVGIMPTDPKHRGTSLDHTMWFHHPPRFDDWLLYVSECPIAHAARGLIFGSMYTPDGRHLATVAQEGLIRRAP